MSDDISPTPWRYDPEAHEVDDARGLVVSMETTQSVIRGPRNGTLLAAAPDLEDALRELVERIKTVRLSKYFERELTGACAALAKAGAPGK